MLTGPRHAALSSLLGAARLRHRTASSAVTEALRQAIISGVLPAGLPLRQDVLAADFGVSRMPIRESIRRLESEGLVDFVPHQGAVVATLQPEEVLEIAQMRLALESVALERSFARMRPADLDEAEEVLVLLDRAESLAERNRLNRRFHAALYGLSPEMRLFRHIDMLHDAYERFMLMEHSRLDRRVRSQDEHRTLLAACRRADPPAALKALRGHIEGAAQELVGYLDSQLLTS